VYVLEHTIVRVVYLPDGVERLDRSWMVVDKNENVPLIGHKRSEIPSFFNQPSVNIENTKTDDIDGVLHIETEALSININYGRSFFIQWSEQGSNRYIASDIPGRSYCRNIKGTDVWHYMRRNDKELIYGLGEKSGPISKTNQHYIMKNVDALGYNAQTSDPLYKHWPFYYCFNRETKLTYGMFYDNQSTSIFDTGKEIDAYHGPYRYYRADNGDIDYYFIFGPTMKQVLQQYVTIL
jgi:alpha-glucosidase